MQVCFIQFSSSLSGKSSWAWAPRLSFRRSADVSVTIACPIKLSSSSASTRSEFQINERSLTEISGIVPAISIMFLTPASSVSVSRKTAACRCIDSCISCLISEAFLEPEAFLILSKRSSAKSPELLESGL